MTAAVTVRHGGPDALEIRHDVHVRPLGPGEVRVRVTAAAVNNTDIWSREGAYGTADEPDAIVGWKSEPLTFPLIQGLDVVGVVDEQHASASGEWLTRRVLVDPIATYAGDFPDRIIGSELDGGFAQFMVCHESQLHDVTESPLTDPQLACLPTAYGTALGMINRAGCVAGERVLVTGASGGVGMAALQLLANRGCRVVAHTSATQRNVVAAQPVHAITVRGTEDLKHLDDVDAVVDVVGGDEFGAFVDALRDGGRLVTAGAIAGPVVAFDIRRLYLRQRTLIGSTMHTPQDFAELAAVARSGGVEPIVAERFPLADVHAAQARFVARDFVGKLVIEP